MSKENEKNIWVRLVEFHVRHYIATLVLISLATGFFLYYSFVHLRIQTDFFDLYPPNHPYVQLYKEYRSMFGTANVLNIILEVRKGTIYSLETIEKINKVTKGLLEIKGVNPLQVISLTHPKLKNIHVGVFGVKVDPMVPPGSIRTEEDLQRLKEKVYSNEGVRGVYVTPDDKGTLITAGFWEEGVNLKDLYKDIMALKAEVEDDNTEFHITGYPMLYAWIHHYSSQLLLVFLLTAIVLTGLLLLYFRSFLGVFVPLISGVLSAVWGLGFASLMGYHIDPLVLVVPLLLSARALSHSVQSMERYHEEYVRVGDKKQAIIYAYGHLYKPAILSIVTDGLGVLTIAVASIPLMRNLAVFSSFWILSIYVSSVVLHPVLVAIFPPPRQKQRRKRQSEGTMSGTSDERDVKEIRKITERPGDRVYLKVCHGLIYLTKSWRRWAVMGLAIVILFGGGYYARSLKVGDTSAGKAILYKDHPYNIAADKLNSDFIGSSRMVVIAEGKKKGVMKDADSMRALEDLQLYAETLPEAGGSVTVTDIIKRIFRMFHEGDPKWGILPEVPSHLYQTLFLLESHMAAGELDRYITIPSFKHATVTIFFQDYNNQIIKDAISGLRNYINEHNLEQLEFRLAGGILGILAAVNEEVEWSYWVNLGLIFSVTLLLCTITFRSILAALVLVIPLAVSQVLSELLMLFGGIDLNINSLPVAAVGVGVGVDYGIYVLSRLGEEYTRSKDYATAKYLAITSTGKAVVFTASTLVAGVIFWVFSSFKFQAEMGVLLAFLMIANMIGSLVLLPVLVSIFGPHRLLLKYRA